jgi:hypothetical protein
MTKDADLLPLASAIDGLRRQIREAAERAEGLNDDELRFRIEKVEVELTVVAEDSSAIGGGVGWWIFKATADVAAKDVVTHKVTLTLNLGDVEVGEHRNTA